MTTSTSERRPSPGAAPRPGRHRSGASPGETAEEEPGAPPSGAARARRRRRALVALGAAALLALTACTSRGEPEPAPTTPSPTVDLPAKQPPKPVPARWPLTGVSGEVQPRPAMSVKVENSVSARPQTGLEAADIVWEEMVEGGITRFNAVYHSVIPEEIGPIRSVRPMDAAISAPLHGLIVFSGGQPQFVQQMRAAGLQVLSNDEHAPGMYRVGFRRAPHNVYGNGPQLLGQADADHSAPPREQLAYAWDSSRATAVLSGAPASRLRISFPASAPGWTWDPAADTGRGGPAGAWVRDEGGAAQASAGGTPIVATNVVVLRVQVVDTGTRDPAGNPVPETVLTGEGEAVVASGGKVVNARWSKTGAGDPLALTDGAGKKVELVPGNTWIELVPTSGGNVSWQ